MPGVARQGGGRIAFASMAILIVGSVPESEVGIATGINIVTRTPRGAPAWHPSPPPA